MREHGKRSSTAVLVIALGSGFVGASARAGEQFLSLPFTSAYTPYISCRWTCLRDDGSVYRHHATDYGRTRDTTSIVAAADGVVSWMHDGLSPGRLIDDYPYGNHVRIRHTNGYETWYAHLLRGTIVVHEGDDVVAGQLLGLSDNSGASSGPHLHFEVRDASGRRVNPYGDPPNYTGGCGPNALWVTCPPTPAPPPDADGDGFTVAQGDCDDSNRDVHPGATESCNGLDDDCNGTADDPWRVGLSIDLDQPCTVGIGACESTSTWVCAPNGATVVCGALPGTPSPESCNGLDDDCDGTPDDTWRTGLTTDLGQPCTVGIGACSRTDLWVCALNGATAICNAFPGEPSFELCNGLDDNCDGETDESWRTGLSIDLDHPCSITWGSGACAVVTSGAWVCAPDGIAVVCDAPAPVGGVWYERSEVCNGFDDDCNGTIDDVPYNGYAYDETHCGGCGMPACDAGATCMQGTCYTCMSGRSLCLEHCLANHCWDCNSSNCGGGYAECLGTCRVEYFTDPQWFDTLCRYGCWGV
ncbi:peptidoglycan DD-metalloendopeptidase family protein [Candidatus Uhrbacteria bacterium]|nr:peptidoglycan DD-metalloendopeptidase family protein [Candidatus Uhrbacteria bacterium]